MTLFCLASSLDDLKKRLGNLLLGLDKDGNPITAHDLKLEGALTALLKDAFLPNLVQTLEGTPAFLFTVAHLLILPMVVVVLYPLNLLYHCQIM